MLIFVSKPSSISLQSHPQDTLCTTVIGISKLGGGGGGGAKTEGMV